MLALMLMALTPASDADFRCGAGDAMIETKAGLPAEARAPLRYSAERGDPIVAPDIHNAPGEAAEAIPSKGFVTSCRRGDLIAVQFRDARRGFATGWLVLRKQGGRWRQLR